MIMENDNYFEEMERAKIEFARLDKLAELYKERLKGNNLNLDIQFETDLAKINLSKLNTSLNDDIVNSIATDYVVVFLDLNKVVGKHVTDPEKFYSTKNLWTKRQPHNIARLIEFIEAGNRIYPPIIQPIENKDLAIIDGNHRIGLLRFYGVNPVPFLVKKDLLKYVEDLK